MPTDQQIVNYFLRTSRGIRATAKVMRVSSVRAGRVILTYKRKHNIR